ncbi:MAG: SOS response-associated peptidase family protein [Pyrinomonadaceae bacterium]|nr:SOS response-associated peptidase family protein [Pyrinomonadaceae bacterium]
MCGRYKLSARHEDVLKHFDLINGKFDYKPSDEIFPGTNILAIGPGHRAENIFWTIEDRDHKGVMRKVINAKSETAHFVPMFRDAFKNGRVLIPATGFYEWKELENKKKEKYEFDFDEPLFAFAGISRECEIKGEPRNCGVILTTEANNVVRPIHAKARMPVILHKYDYEKWLDPDTPPTELKRIMQPLPDDEITAHKADEPGEQQGLF